MVDSFIRRQADRADGLSIVQCLHIFGVSRSGYYSWVRRKKDIDSTCAAKKEQQEQLKEKFRKIVRKLGYVPGKRTFQTHLWREFNISISIKRCRKVMKEMNLVANRPRKDAYKNQATHNHEYSSPKNAVKQNFSRWSPQSYFDRYSYLCDTHTAVALYAAESFIKEYPTGLKNVVASTASPYKFAADVMR